MKKILALILSVSLVVLSSSLDVNKAVAYDENDVKFEEFTSDYIDILVGMGIVGEDYLEEKLDLPATRGDFSLMLASMLNFTSGEIKQKGTQTYFTDVDLYHYAAGGIQLLVERGITQGCGEGLFCPDRTVTAEETSAMLVRALGYSVFESDTISDSEIITLAAKLRCGYSGELTLRQTLKILYNALFTHTLVISDFNPSNLTYSKGDIFLREIMELDYYDGILSVAGGKSILDNEKHNDEVVVDGYRFGGGSEITDDLLGFKVRVFYSKDDADLKAVAVGSLDNSVLTIDAKAYESYSDNIIRYFDKSGKLRDAKLISQKDVLYNTGVVDSIENYIPKYGNIKLINNDSDDDYEVVMISEYESAVIFGVSTTDQIIQFRNRNALKVSDFEKIEFVDNNGKELSLSDLTQDSVACIYIFGDDYIRLEISTERFSGKLDSYEAATGNWQELRISGSEYVAYTGYYSKATEFKPGQNVTLLLDVYGRVAGILAEDTSEWKVGYILSEPRLIDDDIYECLSFKIINQNGKAERINTTESVRLDGDIEKNMSVLKSKINSVYKNFDDTGADGQENVSPRVMRYYLNDDGRITMIDTPLEITMTEHAGVTVSENDKLLMRVKGRLHRPESGFKFKIDSPGRVSLFGEVVPTSNNIAFVVPEESNTTPDENEDYSVTTIQSLKEEKGGNYYITAYNYSPESLTTDILVIRKSADSNGDSNMILVDRVKEVYDENEDETVKQISGYVNAKQVEYTIDEKNSIVNADTIKKGDLISFKVRSGEIVLNDLIWNKDGEGKLKEAGIYSPTSEKHYYAAFRVLLGEVKRMDGTYALLDLGENEFGSDLFTLPSKVIVYDTSDDRNPFYISESNTILTQQNGEGDTVIVAQGKRGGVMSLIVIK